MVKYVKSPDRMIDVVNADGRALKVSQRAFDVVYKGRGYKLASDVANEENYATYSEAELKKVKNDDLKAYLDDNNISYPQDAIKEDLVNAILGK